MDAWTDIDDWDFDPTAIFDRLILGKSKTEPEIYSISNLPMDCLLEICKYLSLLDRINFMTVFPCLQIHENHLFKGYKSVDLNDFYDHHKIHQEYVFKKMYHILPKYVEEMKMCTYPLNCPPYILDYHLRKINKHLKNLQILHISNVDFCTENLQEFEHLNSLFLDTCQIGRNFCSKVSNIKNLQLRFTGVDRHNLSFLTKLESISVFSTDISYFDELQYCLRGS